MRLLLCLLFVSSSFTATASQWDNIERVVAVGDVHGAFPAFVSLLQGIGLIDETLSWTGGSTHLVSLGDFLDRGPESRKTMDLLMRLQDEAVHSGGFVHVLLGNHEVMNLTGDLRYVSSAERAAMADIGGHRAAFAMQGHYGSWLLSLPVMIRINDSIFAHGGFSSLIAGLGIDGANALAKNALRTLLHEGEPLRQLGAIDANADLMTAALDLTADQQAAFGTDYLNAAEQPLLGVTGPMWYRGNAACHALIEIAPLTETLASLGAQRAIIGHTTTPNREVNARLDGRVYAIDTGMLAAFYRGKPRALEIRGESIRALSETGEVTITHLPLADPIATLSQPDYIAHLDANANTVVEFANSRITGRFVGMSKRDAARALAAYRLDRQLGLYMVPATVRREINGKQGIVMAWPKVSISERERQTRTLARPNYCEKISDFSLLRVFDALSGQRHRSADNLIYDRSTWAIQLVDNHRAFGTSARLPEYASVPILPATMASRIASLGLANLDPLLGDLLKSREIKALLRRRDAILLWGDQDL